jgi:hypothetical protein
VDTLQVFTVLKKLHHHTETLWWSDQLEPELHLTHFHDLHLAPLRHHLMPLPPSLLLEGHLATRTETGLQHPYPLIRNETLSGMLSRVLSAQLMVKNHLSTIPMMRMLRARDR